jgi:hypothetical protein
MGQRTRHGGDAIAARRVGPHKPLEADDDVVEIRRRIEGPTTAARGAPSNVYLSETVREVEPAFRHAAGVVDDATSTGVEAPMAFRMPWTTRSTSKSSRVATAS